MQISHKGHNNTIHVYSVNVVTHVITYVPRVRNKDIYIALEAGQSSHAHMSLFMLLHRHQVIRYGHSPVAAVPVTPNPEPVEASNVSSTNTLISY